MEMEIEKSTHEKVICFYGTDAANASNIRVEGFTKGTFFAKHLEDALEFGGVWVFQVCFDVDKLPPGSRQFRITQSKPHTDIMGLTFYADIQQMYDNSDLRERIFDSDVRRWL